MNPEIGLYIVCGYFAVASAMSFFVHVVAWWIFRKLGKGEFNIDLENGNLKTWIN